MKRIVSILLLTAMLLTMAACGKSNAIKTETTHDAVSISDAVLTNTDGDVVLEAKWNNNSNSIISYGSLFYLEAKNNGVWEKVSQIEGTGFDLVKFSVYPPSSDSAIENSNKKIKLNINGHYEVESEKEYRAIIEFEEESDESVKYQAILYFTLD